MPPKRGTTEPTAVIEEFRIIGKFQVFDHSKRDAVRTQDLDLAFHIHRIVPDDLLIVFGKLHFLRIEAQICACSVERGCREGVGQR